MRQTGPTFVLLKVVRDENEQEFPERKMSDGWAEVRKTLNSDE